MGQEAKSRVLARQFCDWRFKKTGIASDKSKESFFRNIKIFEKIINAFGEEYAEFMLNYVISHDWNVYSPSFFLRDNSTMKNEYKKSKMVQKEITLSEASEKTRFTGSGKSKVDWKDDFKLE